MADPIITSQGSDSSGSQPELEHLKERLADAQNRLALLLVSVVAYSKAKHGSKDQRRAAARLVEESASVDTYLRANGYN